MAHHDLDEKDKVLTLKLIYVIFILSFISVNAIIIFFIMNDAITG